MSTVYESSPRSLTAPHRSVGWVLATILLAAVVALLHHDGVPAGDLARYGAYIVWALALPGFVVRRLLSAPARTWFGEISLAITVGLCLELVAWAVFVGCSAGEWLVLWPVAPLMALTSSRVRRRVWMLPSESMTGSEVVTAALSAASLLWMAHRLLPRQPLPGSGAGIYPDLLWHMGLVHEAQRSFPIGTPQVIDSGTLHYHWYSDAHMAASSLVSGVPVPMVVLRLFPALMFALVFAMSVTAVQQLTANHAARAAASALAAATTTFAPFAWLYSSFTSYAPLSPSQLYAGPLMMLMMLALAELLRGAMVRQAADSFGRSRDWAMVALAALGLSGAKASAPLSLLGGVGLLFLWSLAARRLRRVTVVLGLFCVALVGLAMALVAGGDAGTQKQLFAAWGASPIYKRLVQRRAGEGMILPHLLDHPVIAVGLAAGFAVTTSLLLFTVVYAIRSAGRRRPLAWVFAGTVIAAVLAFLVMRHLGLSEFYFLMGVLQVGVVGTSVGVGELLDRSDWRVGRAAAWWSLAWFVVAVAVLSAGSSYVSPASALGPWVWCSIGATVVAGLLIVGMGKRWLRSVSLALGAAAMAVSSAPTLVSPFTAKVEHTRQSPTVLAQQNAAAWIEQHTPENTLLATNKHCSGVEKAVCGSNQWWISGIGGRRVLVEGWSYTPKSANQNPFFDAGLLARNQKAFTSADDDSLAYLKSRGVSYLVAVKGATPIAPELADKARKVYGNSEVSIYRLP